MNHTLHGQYGWQTRTITGSSTITYEKSQCGFPPNNRHWKAERSVVSCETVSNDHSTTKHFPASNDDVPTSFLGVEIRA